MSEHVPDDLEAYSLGALTRADAERVATHLAGCAACRSEVAALAEVVSTLPDTVALLEPRAGLREKLLAAARGDLRRPEAVRRPWSLGRVRAFPLVVAGLASAVIVLGAADLDLYRRLDATTAQRDQLHETVETIREGGRWWYMSGRESFAGSGGTLIDPRAEGKQPFVLFHDLPSIPEGKVLTIWLVSPDSTWARAASFRPSGQDIEAVPITMEVAGFDRCSVTLEDSKWGPRSGVIVMESRIAPPQ
jgi:hypothetical protein